MSLPLRLLRRGCDGILHTSIESPSEPPETPSAFVQQVLPVSILLTDGYRATLDCVLSIMDILDKHYNHAFDKYKDNQQLLYCLPVS